MEIFFERFALPEILNLCLLGVYNVRESTGEPTCGFMCQINGGVAELCGDMQEICAILAGTTTPLDVSKP